MIQYQPSFIMKHPHVSTIYPALFRRVDSILYERVRIDTRDNDFLDLDFKRKQSHKLVILSHGLEGSSQAVYIKSMIHHLSQHGFDCLAWNARTCSGVMNHQLQMYHSGRSDDLQDVIDYVIKHFHYKDIYLVGFSMGANITLKYAGENKQIPPSIKKILAFSVPLSLLSCSYKLTHGFGLVYSRKFLITLNRKIKQKEEALKNFGIEVQKVYRSKHLEDFDNHLTAPLHGFLDAHDYYDKVSSLQFLPQINVPTLIVNALNDPFLGKECYPHILNPFVQTYYPSYGGHVGFYINQITSFADQLAVEYLSSHHS